MARGGLTPEAIATKQFRLSRRGYNPDDVSEFLAEVAAAYQRALDADHQARAPEAERDSAPPSFQELGAEAGALMQAAKEGADSLRRRAEEEAEAIMKRATDEADARLREAALEADRLRNAGRRQCDEMLSEAQARAEHLASHERKLREKVAEVEGMFLAFRNGLDASLSEPADGLAVDPSIGSERTKPAQQAQ